jgi:hypothetical protein
MSNINDIALSTEEKQKIKNKAPNKMPLNPTAKGWSGQEVRKYLSQALVDENGSILASLEEKLNIIKEFFTLVFGDKASPIQAQIDALFIQAAGGILFFEDLETANSANLEDHTIAFIRKP